MVGRRSWSLQPLRYHSLALQIHLHSLCNHVLAQRTALCVSHSLTQFTHALVLAPALSHPHSHSMHSLTLNLLTQNQLTPTPTHSPTKLSRSHSTHSLVPTHSHSEGPTTKLTHSQSTHSPTPTRTRRCHLQPKQTTALRRTRCSTTTRVPLCTAP
jgi:hypothetical protein